jgi:hypothetical protein
MFRPQALAGALAMLGCAVVSTHAPAADPVTPTVHAQLVSPLPGGARVISVEPRDDTDENLRLRDLMAARLRAQNDRVGDDAPLVLRFSIKVVSGLDAPPDSGPGRSGMDAGGYAPPNSISPDTPLMYRLNATLEQRAGPVLWKADVTARPRGRDDRELRERLATALIENIGRTVDPRTASGPPR